MQRAGQVAIAYGYWQLFAEVLFAWTLHFVQVENPLTKSAFDPLDPGAPFTNMVYVKLGHG